MFARIFLRQSSKLLMMPAIPSKMNVAAAMLFSTSQNAVEHPNKHQQQRRNFNKDYKGKGKDSHRGQHEQGNAVEAVEKPVAKSCFSSCHMAVWKHACEIKKISQLEIVCMGLESTFEEYVNTHSSAKVGHASEIKFPFNFKGMKDFVPIKKEFDSMIFGKGEGADFLEGFDTIMQNYMKAISTTEATDLLPIGEINFLLKSKAAAETMRRNGYGVRLVEDKEGFAQSGLQKGGSVFELSHILGLSSDRTRNSGTDGYKIIRDFEEQGLIIFIGNHIKTNEAGEPDVKLTREDDKQMILRVHYKYASPYVLQVVDSNGKVVSHPPESYIHTAVFENQLRLPPKFSRLDLHFLEWIKLFRVQQAWKIVDFDRFLEGNRLIYSETEAAKLYKQI